MAGHEQGAALPQRPAQAFTMPDWERGYPTAKPSLISRLLEPVRHTKNTAPLFVSSDRGGRRSAPLHTDDPPPYKEAVATSGAFTRSRGRSCLDTIFPPNKTYFGRSRRVFLLVIVLPMALLVLLAVCLGLGLGLSHRNSATGPNAVDGASSSNGGPQADGTVYSGELTFYTPGLGACGQYHGDGDAIAAVSHELYDRFAVDGNPNHNALCGRRIRVTRDSHTVDVTVVDRCEGCAANDLDLAPGVFADLAQMDEGRVDGSWQWL